MDRVSGSSYPYYKIFLSFRLSPKYHIIELKIEKKEGEGMKGIVIRWVLNAIALFITAGLIQGIEIDGIFSALVAALVLGIVNAVIRPVIILLTMPINILTLGLLTIFINGLMLKIVSNVVVGFSAQGFWATVVGALLLSIISGVLSFLVHDR